MVACVEVEGPAWSFPASSCKPEVDEPNGPPNDPSPRVLVAILEHHLQADGPVRVPACLQAWKRLTHIGEAN